MTRTIFIGLLLALPSAWVSAQDPSGPLAELAFQAVVASNASERKNDTVELLDGLILEAEPGSATARRLTYRLAALYYRQLKFAQAEALIAPLPQPMGGATSVYQALGVRDGMIYRVQKGELAGARALGEAALPRYMNALDTATLAEEIINSAHSDTVAGSAARDSIDSRRPAIIARTVSARRELARLHSAIAEVHHALKQYPQADKAYRAALALSDTEPGSDAASVLQTRTGLAILLRTQGDAAAALPLQQAALIEMKKIYPANHPDRLETERELKQLHAVLRTVVGKLRMGKDAGRSKPAKPVGLPGR